MMPGTRMTARCLLAILLLTSLGIEAALSQEAGAVVAANDEGQLKTRLTEAESLLQPWYFLLPQELDSLWALGEQVQEYPELAATSRSLMLLAREKLYVQEQQIAGNEPAALALEELRRENRQTGRLKVRKTLFWTSLGGGVGFLALSTFSAYVPAIADRAVAQGSSKAVGFWWNLEDLVVENRVSQVTAGLSVLSFALSAIFLGGGAVQ
jgi:hypothetical protein